MSDREVNNSGTNDQGNDYVAYNDESYEYHNADGSYYENDGQGHGTYERYNNQSTIYLIINNAVILVPMEKLPTLTTMTPLRPSSSSQEFHDARVQSAFHFLCGTDIEI